MKKLLTILTLFASTFVYAEEETKTAGQILIDGFNAIKLEEGSTLTGGAATKALIELREAYLEENASAVTAYATATIDAIENSETSKVGRTGSFIINYYIDKNDLISTISFKVATVVGIQPKYLKAKGVTYSTLKSADFVYDGINLNSIDRNKMIVLNKDYATAKKYPGVLFAGYVNGVKFITSSLLDMTDSSVAYEDSKFWENVALKAGNASVLKKVQDIQDIIYLRLTRDNKIQ